MISEVYWDKGGRISNQDTLSLQEVEVGKKKILFALICDGMGGLQEGSLASGYVAEQMTEWFCREAVTMIRRHKSGRKLLRAGLRVLYGCNEKMNYFARGKGIRFGTTLTAFLLVGGKYYIWHSGDCGLYRVTSFAGRDRIRRLTGLHTVNAHTLTRCIGSFPWKPPDTYSKRLLLKKNSFLLCSDGFWHRTEEERLMTALRPQELLREEQLGRRLRELAGYAKKRGETDNMSAVVIRT